jgi:hypothetical protein
MRAFLKNPLLHRYWFPTRRGWGFGVTAYSLDDAKRLLQQIGWSDHVLDEITGVVEDIDIRTLDADHILPNMGPPNFRGVWYPRRNLIGYPEA